MHADHVRPARLAGHGTVHPSAPEQCNGIDDDCDGAVDDDVVSLTCLPDADGDSFGEPSIMMSSCPSPEGFVPSRPENDCNDNAGFVPTNSIMRSQGCR